MLLTMSLAFCLLLAIGPATFGAVVVMVIGTTLVTPPALKWSLRRTPAAPEPGQAEAFKEAGEDAALRTTL